MLLQLARESQKGQRRHSVNFLLCRVYVLAGVFLSIVMIQLEDPVEGARDRALQILFRMILMEK